MVGLFDTYKLKLLAQYHTIQCSTCDSDVTTASTRGGLGDWRIGGGGELWKYGTFSILQYQT